MNIDFWNGLAMPYDAIYILNMYSTVCSEKIALALDHPNEMPTIRTFSLYFPTH